MYLDMQAGPKINLTKLKDYYLHINCYYYYYHINYYYYYY